MKIETGKAISPNAARLIHMLMFMAACALPTWVFFQTDGSKWVDYLGRAGMLIVIGWLIKGLIDGFERVKEVEIDSIVQCLPWRLAASKKRERRQQ
jgi:hypothetical protein